MPNTTNFNWPTPADTDLVKDGAAAIRNLGDGVDTSLVDLKGGTTGQILSKASDTDMDFAFITPNVGDLTEVQAGTGISVADGTGPIPIVTNTVATEFDAKGDLVVGTGSDTFDRLAVGTDGYTLVADSVETTGLKWVAPASSYTPTLTLLNSGGTSLSGSTTTISGISGKQWLFISVIGASTNTASSSLIGLQFNGDTGSNYPQAGILAFPSAAQKFGLTEIMVSLGLTDTTAGTVNGYVNLYNCNSTELKPAIFSGSGTARGYTGSGYYSGASTISSVSVTCAAGTFDAGTVYVYGA
jgi:hypothetical protein